MRMKPLWDLAADLADGRTSSVALTAQCFDRIEDPDGEGARAFIRLFKDAAMDAAEASDRARGHGIVPSPLAGIPVSIKDLCDVRRLHHARRVEGPGGPPAGGSGRARRRPAARRGRGHPRHHQHDRVRLRRARSQPALRHAAQPVGPRDRAHPRRLVLGRRGLGERRDGGGRARQRHRGVGPHAGRVLRHRRLQADDGAHPGRRPGAARRHPRQRRPARQQRAMLRAGGRDLRGGGSPNRSSHIRSSTRPIAVPKRLACDDLDEAVASGFEAALGRLSAAGARLVDIEFAELDEIAPLNAQGTLPIMEGLAWHRELLAEKGEIYDPIIAQRLRNGAGIPAHVYIDLLAGRRELIARADAVTAPYDAVAMPTLAWVAPPIARDRQQRGGVARGEFADAPKHLRRQLPRPLRHHPALPRARLRSGRADADGRARRRCRAVAPGGGGGGHAGALIAGWRSGVSASCSSYRSVGSYDTR